MKRDVWSKARGAFFTPPELANYLVNWAVQSGDDKVLEPSCGEASFLLAAAGRLKQMGAGPRRWNEQLHGVEIHEASAERAVSVLHDAGFDAQVAVGDFFEHGQFNAYDAVVGNPPFVRYQKFSGSARTKSLEAALGQGVRLSGLASSWAAFVVKAAAHLRPNGRLALVVPGELLSVKYAHEVRRFLLRRFRRVRLVLFEDRVFPGVLEEVVLLLAEGSGGASHLEVYQTKNVETLKSVDTAGWTMHTPGNDDKWTPALVNDEAFKIYQTFVSDRFERLGIWGDAYLGAVTGNNKFFSFTSREAETLGLCKDDLVRISPPGTRHLRGLKFTPTVWTQLVREGARCLLFHPKGEPSAAARKLIALGEEAGVPKAYKCRTRKPWWRVPLVEVPDLFLTYMNHDRPRLISNSSRVHILNSVYGVQLANGRKQIGREVLPIACLNSITLLGTEIVGRSYGGGLLKMEPREADLLPLPSIECIRNTERQLRDLRPQLGHWLRRGALNEAVQIVDKIVLSDVPNHELQALRTAREMLFRRRRARGKCE